jgi:hypothetical protein
MKYQRCRVHPVNPRLDPFYHFAWIPLDQAKYGSLIKLQFPNRGKYTYPEQYYEIKELDDLIIDGYLLPFLSEDQDLHE